MAFATGLRPPHAGEPAFACVVKEKLWKNRQVLKVYFVNPEVLEGWKCEGKKMTTDMILKWAGAWEQAPSAPQFKVTERVAKADVRVKFSGIKLISKVNTRVQCQYLLQMIALC